MDAFDISLGLEGTHVVVTGGAGQIGQVIVAAFLAAGAFVTGIDINESRMTLKHERLFWLTVDVTNEKVLEAAFDLAREKFGLVTACCAAAGLDLSFLPHHATICDLPLAQWQRTLSVNTTGVFLTARAWLRGVRDHAEDQTRNVAFVVIGSEAGVFGVPGNVDYATSKAATQYGLTKSLAPEAVRIFSRARVNAVAPGPVHTPQFDRECGEDSKVQYKDSEATLSIPRAVPMEAVARACLVLVSENYSSNITAQTIRVDGGRSGRVMWEESGHPSW